MAAGSSTPAQRAVPSPLRQRLLLWGSGVCLVSAFGLGTWQWHVNRQLELQKELLVEATVLAQRMAWASNLVLSEDQNALASLKESKSRVGLLLLTLQMGGRLEGRSYAPLLSHLQPLAQELNKIWQPLENACTNVLEGEPVAVNDPRFKAIRVGLDQASLSMEKIIAEHRRNSPKDVNELAAMDDLLFSLQAVSQVLSLTEPGARPLLTGVDPEKIVQTLSLSQAVVDRLMTGHKDSNLKPAPELERVRLLTVRNDLASALRSADSVSALLPKLSANIEASRQVGKHSETLRIQLMLARRKLADPLETTRLLLATLLGVLGFMLLRFSQDRKANAEVGTDAHSVTTSAQQVAFSSSTDAASTASAGATAAPTQSTAAQATGTSAQNDRGHASTMDHPHDVLDPAPANKDNADSSQAALKGVISALQQLAQNTGKAVEQSEQTIKAQAETLKANAQLVLQLAHAFHNISTETTEVARSALKSQQQLGEHQDTASQAIGHWEDVRNQLMKTASKLRKAGEVSRELSQRIEKLPPEEKSAMADLMAQTREALRDAVTGLAEGSVQINYGQRQAQEIAEVLGVSQQQWIELLGRVEVCAGTAAAHTQTALGVSKNLSRAAAPGMKLLKPGE
jgi:hypothetical protein